MTHSVVMNAHPQCNVLIIVSDADSTIVLALHIGTQWLTARDTYFPGSEYYASFSGAGVYLDRPIRRYARCLDDSMQEPRGQGTILSEFRDLVVSVIARYPRGRDFRNGYCRQAAGSMEFKFRKAATFIREKIGEAFTLNDVARESGQSRSHMFGLLQDDLKLKPKRYYNALRLEAFTTELATERMSVTGLSRRLCFAAAPLHFNRFRRANFDVTPSQYRRAVNIQQTSNHGRPVL